MNMHKEYLRQRREFLVLQSAAQRDEVTDLTSRLQRDLSLVNTIMTVARAVRIPLLAIAAAFLLLRIPHHTSLLWVNRLLTAWQLYSVVRKQWQQQH